MIQSTLSYSPSCLFERQLYYTSIQHEAGLYFNTLHFKHRLDSLIIAPINYIVYSADLSVVQFVWKTLQVFVCSFFYRCGYFASQYVF